MSLRRIGLLLLTLLLLGAGALLLLHRPSEPPAPALEQPRLPEEQAEPRAPLQLESSEGRASLPRVAPAPAAAPEPPAELCAEGAQRGWQLPVGKAWWTDTLLNPGGVDPAGAELEALQAQARHWSDQLVAIKVKRKQRLDAYCNERVAAGLAVPDPEGQEVLPEGKEHVIVNTHAPEAPGRFWRVDVGAGDDAELDRLDKQLAGVWCAAVLDLRRSFAKPRR